MVHPSWQRAIEELPATTAGFICFRNQRIPWWFRNTVPEIFCKGHLNQSSIWNMWIKDIWTYKNAGWWFGTCSIFPYVGNNHPNWQRGGPTTNQKMSLLIKHTKTSVHHPSGSICKMFEQEIFEAQAAYKIYTPGLHWKDRGGVVSSCGVPPLFFEFGDDGNGKAWWFV